MATLEDHYEAVRTAHGYSRVDFGLGSLSAAELGRRFAAVDGREAVAAALDRESIVATGVGMTGPPHLGTLGQFLTMTRLQSAGLDVQFVLADLEPYHYGADLETVRRRAERYRSFAVDLGFDPGRGSLRTQEEAREVMHTANLLARYYEGGYGPETEPTAWERAVREMYEDAEGGGGARRPTPEAAQLHSALLHAADFLHPLLKEGYEQVIVGLGIDEHGLTVGSRRFAAVADVDGRIAGLHARMITGVGDRPKMGRSAPGSGIHLGQPPEAIREGLLAPANDAEHPPESLVFQAMRLASEYDGAELDRLERACADGGEEWEAAKREYVETVLGYAERWRQTGGERR